MSSRARILFYFVGSNPTRVNFILFFSFPLFPTFSSRLLPFCTHPISVFSSWFQFQPQPQPCSLLHLPVCPGGLGWRWAGLGVGDRRGGQVGVNAEIKAGLLDTWGFNNHFILCTRDSGKDWGWTGGRGYNPRHKGMGAGRRDRDQGNIYLFILVERPYSTVKF